jgi:hypothetical protein
MTTAPLAARGRSIRTRIGAGLAVAGAAIAFSLSGATVASAQSYASTPLSPGVGVCSASQYGSYQVRADGWATSQGAKFKLLRNGVVIENTANRVPSWAAQLRTSYGTFPGPGYYSVCAQNTGTTNTTATLELRTDSEF